MARDVGLRALIEPVLDTQKTQREVDKLEDELADLEGNVNVDTEKVASQVEESTSAGLEGLEGAFEGMDPVGEIPGMESMDKMSQKLEGMGTGLDKLPFSGQGLLKVALGGAVAVGMLKGISKLADASPAMARTAELFSSALNLFFRPFGDALGRLFAPMAEWLVTVMSKFNKIVDEEGLAVGVVWLAQEVLESIGEFVLESFAGMVGDIPIIGEPVSEFLESVESSEVLIAVGLLSLIAGVKLTKLVTKVAVSALFKKAVALGSLVTKVSLAALVKKVGLAVLVKKVGLAVLVKKVGLAALVKKVSLTVLVKKVGLAVLVKAVKLSAVVLAVSAAAIIGAISAKAILIAVGIGALIIGTIVLWDYIERVSRAIWYWITDASKSVWSWIETETRSIWDFLTDSDSGDDDHRWEDQQGPVSISQIERDIEDPDVHVTELDIRAAVEEIADIGNLPDDTTRSELLGDLLQLLKGSDTSPTGPKPGGPGGLATGGIVRSPTDVRIGEAGPEAVLPIDDLLEAIAAGGERRRERPRRRQDSRTADEIKSVMRDLKRALDDLDVDLDFTIDGAELASATTDSKKKYHDRRVISK